VTHVHPCRADADTRPAGLDIADILRLHGDEANARFHFDAAQRRVMNHIVTCRTAALGGHIETCDHCPFSRPAYNSCRDRHCPKCQALRQAQWVAARLERILPCPHFHVVFTLPGLLRPLAKACPRLVFDLLFRAASDTLASFARDPKWLGAQIGVTAVLHTWTRDLQFHPHLHCVVTGGGLSGDGSRWVTGDHGPRFIFPVAALAKVFRGKILEAIEQLDIVTRQAANIDDEDRFRRLLDRLHRQRWIVYAKAPFAGSRHVFKYLGRYTHRVAISNQRLVAADDQAITFATKDGQFATLDPVTFVRRFLDHVLPDHFVKIRHYGLYASSNVNGRLETARALLPPEPQPPPKVEPVPASETTKVDPTDVLTALLGTELLRCPACKLGTMRRGDLIAPILLPRARGPP